MPTTFANQINNNPIYADRAEKDAAGNTISTTYATKAELPEGVPTVTSSDDGKVLQASYSGGTGSVSWVTPSGGSDIFIATYGTTSFTDLYDAQQSGKTIFCYRDGYGVYSMTRLKTYSTSPTPYGDALFTYCSRNGDWKTSDVQIFEVKITGNSNGTFSWDNTYASVMPGLGDTSNNGKILSANSYGYPTWSALTTSVTDIQQVAALPASPVSTVLYLIPET